MSPDDLVKLFPVIADLVQAHAWVAVAALVIGAVVRALKSDSVPAPIAKIPSRYRPLVAVVLGIVSATLDSIANGKRWQDATLGGLVSASLAIAGHDLFIEGARNGRELGKPAVPPSAVEEKKP